jgi:hypothetical protein
MERRDNQGTAHGHLHMLLCARPRRSVAASAVQSTLSAAVLERWCHFR